MPSVTSAANVRPTASTARPSGESSGLLRRGSSGAEVRRLQEGLVARGHNIAVDGSFGPQTESAVRRFQTDQRIATDGIAGPQTLSRLGNTQPAGPVDQMDRSVRSDTTSRAPRAASQPPAPTVSPRRGISAPGAGANPPNQSATVDRISANEGRLNQMVEGRVTINGNTYDFRSGGGGRGNLPPGDYEITRHLDYRRDRTMQVGGEGYSFAMSDKYDPRVGGTRTLLRIHPDGAGPGTIGCMGIVGDAATQRQFRADMLAELERSGGSFTLSLR